MITLISGQLEAANRTIKVLEGLLKKKDKLIELLDKLWPFKVVVPTSTTQFLLLSHLKLCYFPSTSCFYPISDVSMFLSIPSIHQN